MLVGGGMLVTLEIYLKISGKVITMASYVPLE